MLLKTHNGNGQNEQAVALRMYSTQRAYSTAMISEVVNALFATYVFSEYLLNDSSATTSSAFSASAYHGVSGRQRLVPRPSLIIGALVVILVNVLDRISGAIHAVNELLQGALHIPRVVFAAVAYTVALYVDVNRKLERRLPLPIFLGKVGKAFLRVLPAYPFLAVLISCVFMFVINLWEALHLPLEWLEAPIYYGVLYGPFAWVYIQVKTRVVEEQSSLPV